MKVPHTAIDIADPRALAAETDQAIAPEKPRSCNTCQSIMVCSMAKKYIDVPRIDKPLTKTCFTDEYSRLEKGVLKAVAENCRAYSPHGAS